jgi:hypothetical protein
MPLNFETNMDVQIDKMDEKKVLPAVVLALNENGLLLVEVRDGNSNAQANFGFCLYTNAKAFNSNTNCNGGSNHAKTNAAGIGVASGLITGNTYYIVASDSVGSVKLKGSNQIVLSNIASNKIQLTVQ